MGKLIRGPVSVVVTGRYSAPTAHL